MTSDPAASASIASLLGAAPMTITYCNRKGVTYFLCRGVSKTGKARYYFAREARDEPVEDLPTGYTITESVNGIVSLTQARPSPILPDEVAAVEAQLRRHPRAGSYRMGIRQAQIEVYERAGTDIDEMLAHWPASIPIRQSDIAEVRADQDCRANFTPVLRFILVNPVERTFRTERMCYLSRVNGWLSIRHEGAIGQLAHDLLPLLGTDAFFELW